MKRLGFAIIAAFVACAIAFSPLTLRYMNFWAMMSLGSVLLIAITSLFSPNWLRRLDFGWHSWLWGVVSAAILFAVCWLGNAWLTLLGYPPTDLASIRALGADVNPVLYCGLLMFLIGPSESIFWRGYVQRWLSRRFSPNWAYGFTTLAYMLVHVSSLNLLLVLSGLACGLVWGAMYRIDERNFTAIIISHSLWDVAAFMLL